MRRTWTIFGLLMLGLAAASWLAGCSATGLGLGGGGVAPDYLMVTAEAPYRPVTVPGTQRRVAQTDAEDAARQLLMEHVGVMPAGANQTVNDLMARDSRLRAQILQLVRTAEVVDWQVWPRCNVRVWMRVDRNRIRQILACCPH